MGTSPGPSAEALLVATLDAPRTSGAALLSGLPRGIGGVRVRADGDGGLAADELRQHFGGLLLYSPSTRGEEGGVGAGGHGRDEQLARAAAGFDLVELEVERDLSETLLAAIPPERRLLSWHGATTDAAGLNSVFRSMSAIPARYYRLVVTPRSVTDGLPPLTFLGALNRRDVVAYADGELGLWSRVLAPRLGAPLVFGLLARGLTPATGSRLHVAGEPTVERLIDDFGMPGLGPVDQLYGIVGDPVTRSLSPRLHNAAYRMLSHRGLYLPLLVDDFEPFWRGLVEDPALSRLGMPLRGFTVASPLKEQAITFADRRSPETRASVSSNIFTCRNGSWTASTTDPAGVLEALGRYERPVAGRRAAVVGCGGSGRGIALALARAGAAVTLVNRSVERGRWASRVLGLPLVPLSRFAPEGYDLIVHATPVGREDVAVPFAVDRVARDAAVLDLVYAPLPTPLVTAARARGCFTVDGRQVLEIQVARQFAAMTGLAFPNGVVATTARARRVVVAEGRIDAAGREPDESSSQAAFGREELADGNTGHSGDECTPDRRGDRRGDRDRRPCGHAVEWLPPGMLGIHRDSGLTGPELP
jgi:3-dehydroquinate dehydratase/shikimate dehydrogenase